MPTPFGTPQTQVQPTNVGQVYSNANDVAQQQYQNNVLTPWTASNQYNQALMGGLFGLGGAALGGGARLAGSYLGGRQSNPYAGAISHGIRIRWRPSNSHGRQVSGDCSTKGRLCPASAGHVW